MLSPSGNMPCPPEPPHDPGPLEDPRPAEPAFAPDRAAEDPAEDAPDRTFEVGGAVDAAAADRLEATDAGTANTPARGS